jgi:hypothetical protein
VIWEVWEIRRRTGSKRDDKKRSALDTLDTLDTPDTFDTLLLKELAEKCLDLRLGF